MADALGFEPPAALGAQGELLDEPATSEDQEDPDGDERRGPVGAKGGTFRSATAGLKPPYK